MWEGLWGIGVLVQAWDSSVDFLGKRLTVALFIGLPIAATIAATTLAILL